MKANLIKRTALIYDISLRDYKHFESPRTEHWIKIMHTKLKGGGWGTGLNSHVVKCIYNFKELKCSLKDVLQGLHGIKGLNDSHKLPKI